ncbi:GNAT family acetyltransferase [Brevundimonas sp. Leaf363]|uniref:GNAT family N-acetyltransferase n=1 Tax=Brevundimonas sp. Leaf363 TaxID=1736353 RepID=UPI0006F93BFB|nr:GNAT family N-acetyltransferase [Brevundimonas sp. Leaf363]KQS57335.1 GNAT family acetyltransferase [Brevundimonas sp. Leaf363]
MTHPLDRAVWNALSGRLNRFTTADSGARGRRIDPEVGVFLAAADGSEESLAAMDALALAHPGAGLVERSDGSMADVLPRAVPVARQVDLVQMACSALTPGRREVAYQVLTEADGPAMLALATLTKPGPFRLRTRELGPFIGIKRDGALVAMGGRRLRVNGFTELSGLCTHPDHRGKGYAAALARVIVDEILATGDGAFLHAFADHADSIAFYRRMGFEVRAPMTYTILAEGAA